MRVPPLSLLRPTPGVRRAIRRALGLKRYAALRGLLRRARGLTPVAPRWSATGGVCPVCDASLPAFAINEYDELICPDCLSYPRTRAAMLYLDERVRPRLERGAALRLLHFSPHLEKARALRRWRGLAHLSADRSWPDLGSLGGASRVQSDMEDLPFRARSFELAIALAVVPFVRRDQRAFSELSRVLVPGGVLLLETTLFGERTTELYTPDELERLSYALKPAFEGLLPSSKWEVGGRLLHDPRQYIHRHGWDVRERLEAAGFEPRALSFEALCHTRGVEPVRFGLAEAAKAVLFECVRRTEP